MFEDIDIKAIKKELRNFSKNYIENFNKIEKFVKSEIDEILTLKKKKKSIIPEISFNRIDQEIIQEINYQDGKNYFLLKTFGKPSHTHKMKMFTKC